MQPADGVLSRDRCAGPGGRRLRIHHSYQLKRKAVRVAQPEHLRAHYQNFTEAPMARLRAAGYAGQFTPLEDCVAKYAAVLAAAP